MSIPNFILPKKVSPEFLAMFEKVKEYVSSWEWGDTKRTVRVKLVKNMRAFGRQTLTGVSIRRGMLEAQTAMVLVHELRHVLNFHNKRFSRKDYIQCGKRNYKEYVTQPEEVDCNKQAYYFGVEFYPNSYSQTKIYEIYLDSVGR